MTKLLVRAATYDDAAALFALQPEPRGVTARQLGEMIDVTLKQYPFLVAEWDGVLRGYAYATTHRSLPAFRWSVDVCVQVVPAAPEITRALYESLISHLGEQGFMAIYAAVGVGDSAGAELHRSLGFAPIGVHQSIDLLCEADYWCKTLAATPSREEPMAFTVLQQRQALYAR